MLAYWQPLSALAGADPCFSLAYTLTRVWRDPESVEVGRTPSSGKWSRSDIFFPARRGGDQLLEPRITLGAVQSRL